jgi:alkylation response protein AidB-like acyl-CoA dehydrogenase
VTVQPIITLDGAHEVNEVWLEDVKVPVENLVGEENKGWTYAKFLLGHERTNIAGIGIAKRELARLKRIAAAEGKLNLPLFAARVAQVEIDLMALEITNLRVLSAEREHKAPGPESLDPQDQGHGNPAGHSRTDDAGGRRLRPALQTGRRRPRLCGQPRHRLLQPAQAVDLRRLQRNPEEHHLADDHGPVRSMP